MAIGLAGGVAAGCAAPPPAPVRHEIAISAMAFADPDVQVRIGDTVVFVNRDFLPHNATAEGDFDTGVIAPADSVSVILTVPGSVAFLCRFHPDMTGTIEVVP